MRNKITLLLFCLFCLLTGVMAQGTMTDSQVMEYVNEGVQAGKNQATIAQELMLKGVTRQQLERVKASLANESKDGADGLELQSDGNRSHTIKNESAIYKDISMADAIIQMGDSLALLDTIPQVFGRDIFQNRQLNFAPSENLATPRNYRLGPGDEVIIDIFGANQTTLRSEISPEGSINVDVLGPLYLNGMTISEANDYLKKRLSGIYAGLNRNDAGTDIRLSLGQIRSIQINVLGDVVNPGTYSVSSFATVFHALYLAGGIKEPGTLRNIKVSRNGKTIATVDVYDFLMNGSREKDIRLEEGDVILVPAYSAMVQVNGLVKRPMLFEMKEGESLQKLIDYAGGFAKSAYTNSVTVVRQNGKDYEVHTVEDVMFGGFGMKDGDEVQVGELLSRFENRLTIKGAVFRPGMYQLSGKLNSVKLLIEKAGGLLPEAFTNRAVLHREKEDRTLEVVQVDVRGIMSGSVHDIVLKNNDALFIPSIYDMSDLGTLTIQGEVAKPGEFPYAENTTIEDLILQAGGMLESASTARVDVNRRIKDPNSLSASNQIAETFTFSIKEGFVVEGEPGFVLKPYDEVIVRRSPAYQAQRNVTVAGEAVFTGSYTLNRRDERLSDLVQRIGGFTDQAYIQGARLVRKISADERRSMDRVVESMADNGADQELVNRMKNYGDDYYVGIELDKAIANPGSNFDVVLREGDRLEIPVYSNTVRIMGAVTSPNVVTYRDKKKYKYYVDEAGGYTDMARKRHAYIIHMNGQINQLKNNTEVTPGAEIIVPKRGRAKAGFAEIVSQVGSVAQLATSMASLLYILRK